MAYVRQHPDYPRFRMKVGSMPDFSGSRYADQEIPMGTMNGVNRVFRLAHLPIRLSERIYKDGMMMARASNQAITDGDYYIDYETGEIIFSVNQTPQPKSVIRVSYKYM